MPQNSATSVSTGPIRGSSKRAEQVPGFGEMTIPVRRVDLSNGEHLDLYDTSEHGSDRGGHGRQVRLLDALANLDAATLRAHVG